MKLEISTGQTKVPAGTVLVPVVLGEGKGDRVFLLIHSEGRGEGADNLREECVSVLTHAVLEAEGDGYERLESALKELNGLLKGFLLSDAVRDVHAVVGLLEPTGLLHLSHVGRAEAYVVREGTTTQITEYIRGKPPAAFMHIVSGPVQPKDHFIVSTQRLLRTITPAQLTQMAQHDGEGIVTSIISKLSAEKEVACVLHITIGGTVEPFTEKDVGPLPTRALPRNRAKSSGSVMGKITGALTSIPMPDVGELWSKFRPSKGGMARAKKKGNSIGQTISQFFQDLYDPERKRRAHLLLLAGSAALFLIIWMLVQLSLVSQRSQTKGELADLVKQINTDISTADNRELAGDSDSANAILQRAEDRAQQVMMNESGLYRSEALELLSRIKSKRDEINHVIRIVAPKPMANLSAKKADIVAQGFLGMPNDEFLVYDRQSTYRVLNTTVEAGDQLGTEELILDADVFPRFQSKVFMTTGNSVIEQIAGQPTTMKTEDAAGWVTGADIKTYLRYLYVLAPERKQIYKYERLSDKYGPPAEYNVSGDLAGALDMTITGPVYVLRDTSTAGKTGTRDITKLLRGEKQAFTIRNLPPGALDNTTKIFKSSPTGNFYFLDPENKRVVVTTNDGDLGDSLYVKQYILDADQITHMKDLYVDNEDSRLYLLDEKRIYAIDLQSK